MNRSLLPFTASGIPALFAAIGACSLGACSKSPPAAPAPVAASPAPAPVAAKPMKMVCRNSQTGAKAACGTPNAVMVGMEPG